MQKNKASYKKFFELFIKVYSNALQAYLLTYGHAYLNK